MSAQNRRRYIKEFPTRIKRSTRFGDRKIEEKKPKRHLSARINFTSGNNTDDIFLKSTRKTQWKIEVYKKYMSMIVNNVFVPWFA